MAIGGLCPHHAGEHEGDDYEDQRQRGCRARSRQSGGVSHGRNQTSDSESQHELSDYDALRLCERPWMLYQWLDVGMAAFIPYEKCQLFLGDRIRTYDIEDIEIAAPKLPVSGVEEGTECFVIHLRYW